MEARSYLARFLHSRKRRWQDSLSEARLQTRSRSTARDRKSTRLNSSHANISYAVFCLDRKSTRLNSSHANISYAVFCLKKKKKQHNYGQAKMLFNNVPCRKTHSRHVTADLLMISACEQ